ncbi:MAG: phosphoribosylamine--glycine ligase [Candidatus Brocadiia bacterium]|nr:phosphoribosylamine--glycine ligase [Candidatus Brocadiia bacterium]
MKVLVVGGGGREHALVWKMAQSPLVTKLYAAPGNAGIEELAECVPIGAEDIAELRRFALEKVIDLTVVGPEAPLCAGIVDAFQARGLKVFGPTQKAARIEGSKVFAKQLMERHGIPTANFRAFESAERAKAYIEMVGAPIVVKADGLAAGKAVIVCATEEQALKAVNRIMIEGEFGASGEQVLVEDCLVGEEASCLAITDGETIAIMPSCQDHKPAFDGDEGPNTGGMGAYSPAPVITPVMHRAVERDVIVQAIHAMNREGRDYAGVLYAGIMVVDNAPYVLEFNCRFGDPETQPLLMRLKSDLVPILFAAAEGRLDEAVFEWHDGAALCVVMASGGYPGSYRKGLPIGGLDEVAGMEDVVVFHAGTRRSGGRVVTNGGRVLGVTARGATIREAQKMAYEAAGKIHFEGAHFRTDIGSKAIARLGSLGTGVEREEESHPD